MKHSARYCVFIMSKSVKMKLILVSISLYVALLGTIQGQAELTIYESFDDFEHVLHSGEDKIFVINFWATWCKPCVEELPYFEELHETDGIEVVLVSLDFKNQIESKLKPFLKERALQSKVVVLADTKYNNWLDKVNTEWSGAIPATYIYSGDASIFKEEEFSSVEEITSMINSIKI